MKGLATLVATATLNIVEIKSDIGKKCLKRLICLVILRLSQVEPLITAVPEMAIA